MVEEVLRSFTLGKGTQVLLEKKVKVVILQEIIIIIPFLMIIT